MPLCIEVGARESPLSIAQLDEVLKEIRFFHPDIVFSQKCVKTVGDKDKKTSLRGMGKTDFFTKEIDDMLLKRECQIAIHSAKDLPEPLPKGIVMVALTKGVDSADVVVMREGDSFYSLPEGAVIATSSDRREECVRNLRSDLRFIDLRGTIGERLELLSKGVADGVVVAKAALIRLKQDHLNSFLLPGETAHLQGRLAILARESDLEMKALFQCIDAG